MSIDERGRAAGLATVAVFEAATDVTWDFQQLGHRRRSQRRHRAVAALVVAAAAVFVGPNLAGVLRAESSQDPAQPSPGIEIGEVPVWYDSAGLHRGTVVEETAVDLLLPGDIYGLAGRLALVRTGAVYSHPISGDVWFHPWGGEPRVIGNAGRAGPGGDPGGDTAAWFDGSELVVYDTAAGREVSRALAPAGAAACRPRCQDHLQGNGFLEVSADRVVWTVNPEVGPTYAFDVDEATVREVTPGPVDTHRELSLFFARAPAVEGPPPDGVQVHGLEVRAFGERGEHFPLVPPIGRFSATGDFVLTVTEWVGGRATILDARTGDTVRVPDRGWPWLAWSYGDIALIDTTESLLACDARTGTCQELPAASPRVLPTS